MHTANSRPLEGPVILAKVGRMPSPDGAPAPPEKLPARPSRRALEFVCGVLLCSWIGLMIGALARREWACLPWLGAGALSWLCIAGIAAWVQRAVKRERAEREVAPPVAAPPDERLLVLVDRLREQTAAGAFGAAVRAGGTTAWFLEDGLYLSTGRHLPWKRFAAFRLEAVSPQAHRVRLRWSSPASRRSVLALGAIALLALAAYIAQMLGGMAGFHRYGPRDDVLAVLFFAFYSLLFLMSLLFLLVDRRRSASLRHDMLWLALINRDDFSDESVLSLFQTHLPMERGAPGQKERN